MFSASDGIANVPPRSSCKSKSKRKKNANVNVNVKVFIVMHAISEVHRYITCADIDAFMLVKRSQIILYFAGLDCLQQYTGLVDHNML